MQDGMNVDKAKTDLVHVQIYKQITQIRHTYYFFL